MKKHYIFLLLSSAIMLTACGNEDSQRDTVPSAAAADSLVSEEIGADTTLSTTTSVSSVTTKASSTAAETEMSTTTTVSTTKAVDTTVSETTTTTQKPVTTTTSAPPVTKPKTNTTTVKTATQVQFKKLNKTSYSSTLATFYFEASEKSRIRCYIPKGTAITVTAVSSDGVWYNAVYNGLSGFVKAGQTTDTKPTVTTSVTVSQKPVTTTTKAPANAQVSYQAYESADQQTIINLTNELRNSLGLGQLKVNDKLSKAAAIRAKEIAKTFDHSRPDGSSCFTAIDGDAVFWYLGENIAMRGGGYNTLSNLNAGSGLFEQWKTSEGHYKNMVTPEFNCIGVGVYYEVDPSKKTYAVYGVQMFGQTG